MRQAPVHSKLPRGRTAVSMRRPTAGPDGIALAPPTYGIDFLDQQRSTDERMPIQRRASEATHLPERRQENRTGLPDHLKSGIESLSGLAMDDVRVHYNSSKPAEINALAYTQGSDIHVAPGQEQHLPHEAWHVVQQAQGSVKPTMQMKDGAPVNDDAGLEHEADVMSAKALAPAAHLANASYRQEQTQGSGLQKSTEAPTRDKMRLQGSHPQAQHFNVIQAEKKIVNGVEVDTDGGYTNWEGWHINWKLGSKKDGFEQFHLTSQDRTQHYFFIINGTELEDTKPPAKLVPKRGTHGGLSKAPKDVQQFVRTYINDLLP
jgi:hypothetical protein